MSRQSVNYISVFVVTFLSMVSRRAALEGWSFIKSAIQLDLAFSSGWLGIFDTCYLVSYSIGEIVNGMLCDKYKVNVVVSSALFGAGCSLTAMSILGALQVNSPVCFLILWGIEGYCQSAVFPGSLKALSSYVPKHIRAKIMGFWGSNASIGNMIGTATATILLTTFETHWTVVIFSLSAFIIVIGFIFFFLIKPVDSKLSDPLNPESSHGSYKEIIQIPGVLPFTMTYSCTKLMNYTVIMWLPLYLHSLGLGTSFIGVVVFLYDTGAIVGSVMAGWLANRFSNRLVVIMTYLGIALPLFSSLMWVESAYALVGVFVFLGMTVTSTCYQINSTVSIELAGSYAGTIGGFIDGCGSMSTAIGMLLIGFLQGTSWNLVWTFVITMNIFAFIPLIYLRLTKTKQ